MGSLVHMSLCGIYLFAQILVELQTQTWWDNAESIQHFQDQVTEDSFVNLRGAIENASTGSFWFKYFDFQL